MSRFELTVSPDYVPDWTEVEAIRELFQNALDSEGQIAWFYDDELDAFEISNDGVGLTKETLLFGATTKNKDPNLIGNFGEGYKLAFLVLARLGHKVTVYNYAKSEIWYPKIIKSRRYKSDLLVVDVEKKIFADKTKPLTFFIGGITKEIYKDIEAKNLHIKLPKDIISTFYGDILTEPRYSGEVFVKGLYVCAKPELKYGYDIAPKYLETNRDRNLVSDFDVCWITSRIWGSADWPLIVSKMIKSEIADVCYVDNFKSALTETMYTEFIAEHGKYAVPVTSQKDYDSIKQNYKRLKPIFVTPLEKSIVYGPCYSNTICHAPLRVNSGTPKEILARIFTRFEEDMSDKLCKEFVKLIETSEQWTFK